MKDQFRLLWTGISGSKKIRSVCGDRLFRIGCHLVYTWLLPWCDDDGRIIGEPLSILANVVPNEGFEVGEIEKILAELDNVELIRWYSIDGERFIQIVGWEEHQRIRKDRYKPSRYPAWKPGDDRVTTSCQPTRDLSPSPTPTLSPSEDYAPTDRKRSARSRPPSNREEYFLWFDKEVDNFLQTNAELMAGSYPAVSPEQEASKAKLWIRSNCKKRKSDIPKFMNAWFSRAQDRGGFRPGPASQEPDYSGNLAEIIEAMKDCEAHPEKYAVPDNLAAMQEEIRKIGEEWPDIGPHPNSET
jgi:hypothetical protein